MDFPRKTCYPPANQEAMHMLTIRVDNGQKSRTYQLDHDQILIGFRSGAHLVLPTFEEDSGELRVDYDDQYGYTPFAPSSTLAISRSTTRRLPSSSHSA